MVFVALSIAPASSAEPVRISGRYPHLTMYNAVGEGECGVGAVVPWADRLWVITYAPHKPQGSGDKLFEIDGDLRLVARPESVGGTPASRMIHRESQQLIIGPYFIDRERNVRVIPPSKMPGRLTAAARHLSDPANWVYLYDMEGQLYEVNVHTLDVNKLFHKPVPGWHGKGAYTGQGRLVVANNGEMKGGGFRPADLQVRDLPRSPENAGVLAQWDGQQWQIVERRQFTDITSPDGIYGASSADTPLWAIGWDKRSLLLKVLHEGAWQTYRLPKADHSYDAAHGWFTEWPRIREVVPASGDQTAKLLMNMHGGWFDFPIHFRPGQAGGLRPLGSHLKITGDFAPWRGEIVFGCDDTATVGNALAGQSHSNLWFASWDELQTKGRPVGWGGPWIHDQTQAGMPSAPYLFAGHDRRVVHLAHESDEQVTFTVEVDPDGAGNWKPYQQLRVPAHGYHWHVFPDDLPGQWIRFTTDRDAKRATAYLHYGVSGGAETGTGAFASLANVDGSPARSGGILRTRGEGLGTLAYLATPVSANGEARAAQYYELDADLKLEALPDETAAREYHERTAAIDNREISVDAASVIIEQKGRRWRLPKSSPAYEQPWPEGPQRGEREVVTERSLLNVHGTFYVLPRENSTGIAGIKPVCTHNKRITDFCSWRGLLVLTGTKQNATASEHLVTSADGSAGLWLGDVDDLWRLGKPRGHGGPWQASSVKANEPSDPYLMAGYDRKRIALSHDAQQPVAMTVEVDFLADGSFKPYQTFTVPPGKTIEHAFPAGFAAYWVRLRADQSCQATATLTYE